MIDYRGVTINFPLDALAHLQLGRACALSGDTAKARTSYQDFFALWKGADSDIPILKEAKAERSTWISDVWRTTRTRVLSGIWRGVSK
jgi:hypothetical protein